MTFQAEITKHLNKIADLCEKKNPDQMHNTGRQLGLVFFWTMIEKFAEAKKKDAWKYLADNEVIEDCSNYDPGEYSLAESPHFFAKAKISQPVKRFDADTLALALNKKYKVPVPIAKEMIEQAKVPSKSTVTKSVVER